MINKENGIQKCYLINFLNYQCTIYSSADLLNLWSDFVDPYFKIALCENIKSEYAFYIDENYSTVERLINEKFKHTSHQILLHCDVKAEMYTDSTSGVIVLAKSIETAYMIEKHSTKNIVRYICNEFGSLSCLDLFRLVRGVLEGQARQAGALKVHMSAATLGNNTIAFIGDAGAGKTSFMLSFLKNYYGAGFLTNDKVLLNIDNRNIYLYGLPYAVSIGYGSLKCCEEIIVNQNTRIINEEAYFWPKELSSMLGCEVVAVSSLKVIFIVKINHKEDGLTFSEITCAEEKYQFLKKNVLCYSDKVTPYWLLNILGINIKLNEKVKVVLTERRLFRIYGNPWGNTFKDVVNKIISEENKHDSAFYDT